MASSNGERKLRSQAWWDDSDHPEMTALWLERFLNYGGDAGAVTERARRYLEAIARARSRAAC